MDPTNTKRPFLITVQPRYSLKRCPLLIAEEARGFFGHRRDCPECVKTLEGYDLQGENGHRQGTFNQQTRPTAEQLAAWAGRLSFAFRHHKVEFQHSEQGFCYVA